MLVIDNALMLVPLLKTLTWPGTSSSCKLEFTHLGLSVSVSRGSLQAHLDIPKEFFSSYSFDQAEVGVDLATWIDCLTLLQGTESTTSGPGLSFQTTPNQTIRARMAIRDQSFMEVMLDQPGSLTVCKLKTTSPELYPNDVFLDSELVASVIIKAEWLKETLAELDVSSTVVALQLTPSLSGSGSFKVISSSASGEAEIQYKKESDVIEQFFCCDEGCLFKYNYNLLQQTFRGFSIASKVSLRINSMGALSLQVSIQQVRMNDEFMLPTEQKHVTVFAEFLIPPTVDEES